LVIVNGVKIIPQNSSALRHIAIFLYLLLFFTSFNVGI
jgi:hypothetical protein